VKQSGFRSGVYMTSSSLIRELDRTVKSSDAGQRATLLPRVVNLFRRANIKTEEDERLELFDELFAQLIVDATTSVLAQLSHYLSEATFAPINTIQQLAQSDAIEVAYPILTRSNQITEETLIHIARTKCQDHLQAIAIREQVTETISDLLIERGESQVIKTLTANPKTAISQGGFGRLIERFSDHNNIVVNITRRRDLPPRAMRALLTKAPEGIRALIFRSVAPDVQKNVLRLLREMSAILGLEKGCVRVTSEAFRAVYKAKEENRLNEDTLAEFARKQMFGETVVSISMLTQTPIDFVENQMRSEQLHNLIVICKSIKLNWATVLSILSLCEVTFTPAELEEAGIDYSQLLVPAAQRAMHFYQLKQERIDLKLDTTIKHKLLKAEVRHLVN
jgi:uncharacterized protein (DUF2336 family)